MRYLVRARVKSGREGDLLKAIENETLGQGSVAEGEYLRNMHDARLCPDQTARWVEVCYCPTPLQEERQYWEEYFDLVRVQDAHDRRKCRDENGKEPWACHACDCTARLEETLKRAGPSFMKSLPFGTMMCEGPVGTGCPTGEGENAHLEPPHASNELPKINKP
jgi:hypothetical protein